MNYTVVSTGRDQFLSLVRSIKPLSRERDFDLTVEFPRPVMSRLPRKWWSLTCPLWSRSPLGIATI